MDELIIRKKEITDIIPWNLLLLADPSRENVQKYIDHGEIFLAYKDTVLVGEYVLTKEANDTVELKNLAVDEQYQNKGIGKKLVEDVIERLKKQNAKRVEVGTGNSSLSQLSLYQKCGFRIIGIDKDFFVKNYKEKIMENGIECRDMIRLAINFD
ncbi:MAG: GNAT family N-acetyltransferase [Candidatus Levybacteria bacterium CG_4_10_14_0_2_um_filter_36_16]|nr:MAG: GNAT family N-acetyltransferase [Candidatus Levybacteria bacterium CG2_30_37_29]PIZ96327.1 MAG: GNAT family N-acetyltransferase [Candidatus Levybacteria bacterium CG_4_10_14_0_2_um_filter_36_16]PJA90775.1 MAG: GNAT family N-acetyltransferase [Candidatus Levybacteria bacterium CG_4_9_14_3_um_filter_36_7]